MDKPHSRISNFHLSHRLNDGLKCEIFEARYCLAGGVVQPAVVKLLKPEIACIGKELRAFLREVGWARVLRHRLFPRVMEAGEHDGHYFLAMERIDGRTLEGLLGHLMAIQRSLPFEVGLNWSHQIADGLAYLHQSNVVHLGLQPANLLMRRQGHAALVDFGETGKTHGDVVIVDQRGTSYQAPERTRMLPVDQRADIYSLGKIIETMSYSMDADQVGTDLPALIGRACSMHVEDRFESMQAFMDGIEVVATNHNVELSADTCSRFLSEVFGDAGKRVDPRSRRPQQSATPFRMPSQGIATVLGSVSGDDSGCVSQKVPKHRVLDEHLAITTLVPPCTADLVDPAEESTLVTMAVSDRGVSLL